MVKYDKRLTFHLLHLVEYDDFHTAYYVLTKQYDKVNINAKTSSGDYLSSLLSYAACEHGLALNKRIYAFHCLRVITDKNLFVVNQIAGDGGGVLHCALASASSSWVDINSSIDFNKPNDEDEIQDDESDSDRSQDQEESDGDEEYRLDQFFLQQMKIESLSLENTNDVFNSITSSEVTVCTVLLLCKKNADVSLPLIQQTIGCDDDEEEDMIFSRQSLNENWTPLMFALEWCIITCIKFHRSDNLVDKLTLPTLILVLLMVEGSDPDELGDSTTDVHAIHIIASLSYFLSRCNIQGNKLIHSMVSLYQSSLNILGMDIEHTKPLPIIADLNLTDEKNSYYNILSSIVSWSKYDGYLHMKLSPVQNFAVQLFTKDASAAHEILHTYLENTTNTKDELFRCWCNTSYGQLFPILQSVWPFIDAVEQKSIFEMAAYLCLADEFQWLVQMNHKSLTDEMVRKCAISVFQNFPSRGGDNMINDLKKEQEVILSFVLGADSNASIHQRQPILDRLLVESCSGKMWSVYSPDATWMLVKYGADPNIESIADIIQGGLKPLHLIAANCRGSVGVEKLSALVNESLIRHPHKKANLLARTSSPEEKLAVDISLEKRNFHVSGRLLELLGGTDFIRNSNHTLEHVTLLGMNAIHNASYDMFHDALVVMENFALDSVEVVKSLGLLMITAIDERSGFSKSSENDYLIFAIREVHDFCKRQQITNLSSRTRDNISGYNLLHLLIRTNRDRPSRRIQLIRPLCDLLKDDTNASISQPCANSFGGYTPLHLAYSVGCEVCIRTLLDFGADENIADAQGNKPIDLIHL